ncbi:hypothetical protein DKX15_18265, partial [Enterococcus faecium]
PLPRPARDSRPASGAGRLEPRPGAAQLGLGGPGFEPEARLVAAAAVEVLDGADEPVAETREQRAGGGVREREDDREHADERHQRVR